MPKLFGSKLGLIVLAAKAEVWARPCRLHLCASWTRTRYGETETRGCSNERNLKLVCSETAFVRSAKVHEDQLIYDGLWLWLLLWAEGADRQTLNPIKLSSNPH